MVLRDRAGKLRPGAPEELGPLGGIEMFGREHRDEILVAKFGVGSVGGDVVIVFLAALLIHVARIPFIGKSWHAIKTPVDKDAKLAINIPGWHLIAFERFPIGLEGTGRNGYRWG